MAPITLKDAQKWTTTPGGLAISDQVCTKIITLREQAVIRAKIVKDGKNIDKWAAVILTDPFINVAYIDDYVGLTGVGGLIQERFKLFSGEVKCIITVAHDVARFQIEGVNCIRVPLADDPKEDIYSFFGEVTNLMKKNADKGYATIVHCACGVSRSASFVIAYLMRYRGFNLEQAFRFVKMARSVIAPNIGFLVQLRRWEARLKSNENKNMVLTPWKAYTKNEKTLEFPVFIYKNYLNDYNHLFKK